MEDWPWLIARNDGFQWVINNDAKRILVNIDRFTVNPGQSWLVMAFPCRASSQGCKPPKSRRLSWISHCQVQAGVSRSMSEAVENSIIAGSSTHPLRAKSLGHYGWQVPNAQFRVRTCSHPTAMFQLWRLCSSYDIVPNKTRTINKEGSHNQL